LAMNSGMETVSISTKSALPNSRLSCSAIVPALGFRWSQADSGGCARAGRGRSGGPAASSGGVGAGLRGGARAALGGTGPDGGRRRHSLGCSGPARLWADAPGGFRSSRGCYPAYGGRDTETETAAAGPASGLGLAQPRLAPPRPALPRPGLSSSTPLRQGPPLRGRAFASSPGRRARAGRGRAPGWLRRLCGSAP
jgi:hypothetical protein